VPPNTNGMYIPPYYKNQNPEEIREFLQSNSFGILINQAAEKLFATHIPMELETDQEGRAVLVGHLSKANPQSDALDDLKEVLAIFSGPDTYVSSSWYESEEVPTWNYMAVHVYGHIELLTEMELNASLDRLVKRYEAPMENPIQLANLSEKTLNQAKRIRGFKLVIRDIQAAFKLSQTRTNTEKKRIISELESCPHANAKAIAAAMKNLQTPK